MPENAIIPPPAGLEDITMWPRTGGLTDGIGVFCERCRQEIHAGGPFLDLIEVDGAARFHRSQVCPRPDQPARGYRGPIKAGER